MPQQSGQSVLKNSFLIKEPDMFHVVMLNDDFTPMDFVVRILAEIFYKTQAEAEQLMMKIHKEGEALVGTYTYDIARTKSAQAVMEAREEGYPLRVVVRND